jgi:TatD DNase family protein
MFIDFHTHHDRQSPDLINLQTLDVTSQLKTENLPDLCSLGLHPWFIQDSSWQAAWSNLEALAELPQVVAIGECGLDRHIDLPLALQTEVFIKQIELADKLHKPLIIHCVKAFAELIAIREKTKSRIPWIIHGFNKKEAVWQQLLNHNFYFSFGAAILSDRAPVVQAIATIADGRFLLETDDRIDITIEQIYDRAAQLRKVPVSTLQNQLLETYSKLTRN